MLHRSMPSTSTLPGHPVRVLVETADSETLAYAPRRLAGLDVSLCSGPASRGEVCPLVAEGACPFGDCDVVVCDLDGPWHEPVREAWIRRGVVVARRSDEHWRSPADQLDAYLGAALTALYRANYAERTSSETDSRR